MARLTTPVQPTPSPAAQPRSRSIQTAGTSIGQPWLAAIATITVIMVVIFCAAIVLATEPTNPSTRGSDEPSFPLSAAPTLVVGEVAATGD